MGREYAAKASAYVASRVRDGRIAGTVLVTGDGMARLREGYGRANREWREASGKPAPHRDMNAPDAAGPLYSTVDDLANRAEALESGKAAGTESYSKTTTP